MKYKIDQNLSDDRQKEIFLQAIANEIAEQNRLTRISLSNNFIQAAAAYAMKEDSDGAGNLTEEGQKRYERIIAGIEFSFSDHLGKVDEDKLKEAEAEAQTEGAQTEN